LRVKLYTELIYVFIVIKKYKTENNNLKIILGVFTIIFVFWSVW